VSPPHLESKYPTLHPLSSLILNVAPEINKFLNLTLGLTQEVDDAKRLSAVL
jgi:hypothetical protein